MSEARTEKGFPLELPIKIHKGGQVDEHSGVTGNLSAAGVYIRADACLEIGSNGGVRDRPAPGDDRGQRKRRSSSAADGSCVPMNPQLASPAEARGVACVIDSYDFVRHS